jgi:hypothetical protein
LIASTPPENEDGPEPSRHVRIVFPDKISEAEADEVKRRFLAAGHKSYRDSSRVGDWSNGGNPTVRPDSAPPTLLARAGTAVGQGLGFAVLLAIVAVAIAGLGWCVAQVYAAVLS